jgi:hypothetical protein
LILISTDGEPVMLVPAPTIEEARKRAITLMRASPGDKSAIGDHGCRVTLFMPALQADGEVLAYQPVRSAEHGTDSKGTARYIRSH